MNKIPDSFKKWYTRNMFVLVLVILFGMNLYNLIFINRVFGLEFIFDILIQCIILIPLFFLYKQQSDYTEKLVDSEQRYQSLFLYNNAGIYVINLNGTINSISPNLMDILGYSEAEIKNQHFTNFFAPEEIPFIQQTFLEITSGNKISSWRKIKIRHRCGEYFTFDFSSAALRVGGVIQGVIGFAKDITELERTQDKLNEIQTQMNNIYESIDIVLWSLDVAMNKVITISPACEKVFGYTPEEYYENPDLWLNRVHYEDKELVNAWMAEISKGGPLYNNIEHRMFHLNGEIRWVESRVFPIMNSKGQMIGINGVMFDITHKKMIEENHQTDLELARLVQKSVLSQPVYTPSFSIDARYIPSQHLGGDMYAWYRIDEHRYGVLIMDVMGHGVSSSLICMSIRALLKGIIQACMNPEDVIKELNDHMNKLFSETVTSAHFFFTAIYLIVDKEINCIDYINAGHPSGLLMDALGEIHDLESTCIPIGFMPDLKVEKKTIQLNGPARLVLFTDGLIEMPGSLLQEQINLVKNIMKETRMDSMPILMDRLLAFSNESKQDLDDVCLICMDM
jgi:sigma-B regulation protein RsbU (phosphoserine phosphatase)